MISGFGKGLDWLFAAILVKSMMAFIAGKLLDRCLTTKE